MISGTVIFLFYDCMLQMFLWDL